VNKPSLSTLRIESLTPFGPRDGTPRFHALRLSHPVWTDWQPGQFCMVRPPSFGRHIPWGRPLCICHVTSRHLVFFLQTRGRGTRLIAGLAPGDTADVWGPLGQGFAAEANTPTLLLAGGMGIAPFVGYVNRHPTPWTVSMLFGHREHPSCYPIDNINEHIPVDSLQQSTPEELDDFAYCIGERISEYANGKGLVLACGPMPFLRVVQGLAAQHNARTQLSLETRMACGIGACLGCVVIPAEPNARPVQACVHGPVFWADQVRL
jgi:dihydroorotate dehydrogenase electron transfer subunit